MDSRGQDHHHDLCDVSQYGRYLTQPSNQLVRLVRLLDAKHRVRLVSEAHRFLEGSSPKSSLAEFAARHLVTIDDIADLGAEAISGRRLLAAVRPRALAVRSGENYRGVALILANTLLASDLTRDHELVALLARTMKRSALTPEQAAALVSVVEYNKRDIARFEDTAASAIADTGLLPSACFSSREEQTEVLRETQVLEHIVESGREAREAALLTQRELITLEELCHTHRLAQPHRHICSA